MCGFRMMYSLPIKAYIIHRAKYTTNTQYIERRLLCCKKLESVLYFSISDLDRIVLKIGEVYLYCIVESL